MKQHARPAAARLDGLALAFIIVSGTWATASAQSNKPLFTFSASGGEVEQRLAVRERKKGGIEVALTVTKPCQRKEAGVAAPAPDAGDPELESDAEGEATPVDVFLLKPRNQCTISIRLATDDRSHAWVREKGCATRCPLTDQAMSRE